MTELLGLPLDAALEKLGSEGINDISICEISAPRGKITRGTLRVVRQCGKTLTVCRFPDTVSEAENETDKTD